MQKKYMQVRRKLLALARSNYRNTTVRKQVQSAMSELRKAYYVSEWSPWKEEYYP